MTLILSASDFTIVDQSGAPTNLAVTGTARLHADIDSALKGYDSGSLPSSSYCREYSISQGQVGFVATMISGSVEGGAYSGSLGDNAVSIRAWIMHDTQTTEKIYLFVKNTSNALYASTSYNVQYLDQQLTLRAKNSTKVTLTGVTKNEWHRVRMDYIPIAGMKDVISLYTSSAGGTNTETWELIGTAEILNTDPSYITASTPALTMGYGCSNYGASTNKLWIDDFDVYVTPAG